MKTAEILEVIRKRKAILQMWIEENKYPEDLETHETALNELENFEKHITGHFEYDSYIIDYDRTKESHQKNG